MQPMKYLIDTHILIWLAISPEKISKDVLSVTEKNWMHLESCMAQLQVLSDRFVELESSRIALSENIVLAGDRDIAPVLTQVRGKLQKSKIENHALNEYIKTTRKFLQGVFDSVVPQRRNTLYSRTGKIVRPELSSLVLNQVM